MRIGGFEIEIVRRVGQDPPKAEVNPASLKLRRTKEEVDYTGALAVADTAPWWKAVHQILDEAELETIQGARNKIGDTNECIAAVGAGEGVDLVRIKLNQAREIALKPK